MAPPEISNLTFLILDLIGPSEQSGAVLRDRLEGEGVTYKSPSYFYSLMDRLEGRGLVAGRYPKDRPGSGGGPDRLYKRTAKGYGAWQDTCDFYRGRFELQPKDDLQEG